MIEVRDLHGRFGDFELGPLSLAVGAGEYWAVLGPSGAGKTLLLHALAGLAPTSGGEVRLGDADVSGEPPERRRVGLVMQQASLFPHLSVRANLAYGLWRAARHERDARVDAVIRRLELAPLLGRPVATLSGGEAQKVALGRALAIKPRVLMLDEPLGQVDPGAREALQAELRRVHRELDLTTLHVTHSRAEARAQSDHCAVVVAGRLVQHGPTAAVLARPRCPFVARFLGAGAVPAPQGCDEGCARGTRCSAPAPAPTE